MLSAGAGAAGNGPGLQVYNDAFNLGYTGPCPPPGSESNTDGIHHYVFTVYALDTKLDLIPAPAFPPYADGLYRAHDQPRYRPGQRHRPFQLQRRLQRL